MSLSDVMGHLGLGVWAELALVLFMVAFAAIVASVFAPGNRARLEAFGSLPLEEDPPAPRATTGAERTGDDADG